MALQAIQPILLRHVRHLKWLLVVFWAMTVWGHAMQWWRIKASWLPFAMLSAGAVLGLAAWANWQRERLIRERALPLFLRRKLRENYPHLATKDVELVERGLRQFFVACSRSQRSFVAMPSKVVDAMWHEFILHTRAYQDWCELALGHFLHHTPAEALGISPRRNDGLRRAWYWACKDESINPRHPTRLPLLFALDAKLGIEGGFHYVPDCRDIAAKSARNGSGGDSFCGTSFSDGSSGGDSGSFGGAESSHGGHGHDGSSDGGGDGGSDGSGGDGGGCGGD